MPGMLWAACWEASAVRLVGLCTEKDEKRLFLFPQISPAEYYSLLHPEQTHSSQSLGVSLGFRLPRHLVISAPKAQGDCRGHVSPTPPILACFPSWRTHEWGEERSREIDLEVLVNLSFRE